MKEYKARIADKILAEKLDAMGAVLIEGPKYCGKTTLASRQDGLLRRRNQSNRLGASGIFDLSGWLAESLG